MSKPYSVPWTLELITGLGHSVCPVHQTQTGHQVYSQQISDVAFEALKACTTRDHYTDFCNLSQQTHEIVLLKQKRAEFIALDSSFFIKARYNIKRLFDPSWVLTNALMSRVTLLILILFKCFLQHIQE